MTRVLKNGRGRIKIFAISDCTKIFTISVCIGVAILIAIVPMWINHNLFIKIENHNNCIGISISQNWPFFKTLKTIVNEMRLC